jgi:hypothetical protein
MQSKFEQLLDYLVNEETEKAEELFHEIVVEKSRNIYENLIAEEEKSDDDEDENKEDDKQVDEMFDEVEEESVIEIGGDPTDDLVGDVEFGGDDEGAEDDMGDMGGDDMGDMGGELGGDDGQDERIDDLEDALADLKAEFEKLMSGEEGSDEGDDEEGDADMGGDEEGDEEGDDEEDFLREYVDKVTDGHGAEKKGAAEKADNKKSPTAGENRMGGTAFKLGQGDEKGGVKGGLLNPSPKDMGTKNVNVKGGTSAKQFYSNNSKGHGAEKAGSGETNVNAKSPLAPSHAK